ncbi:MAG: hypothetical protein ACW976_06130 [Candidatus Ranarchaeia archaeon]|jgi:ABC-type phosphate/phosphonate transport system permease subunit
MSNRSAIGPLILLAVGVLIVLFSTLWFLGVDLLSGVSAWASNFGDTFSAFFSVFGESLDAFFTNFGEFMGNWGENFSLLFTSVINPIALQMIGGTTLMIVGLIIIISAFKSLRK